MQLSQVLWQLADITNTAQLAAGSNIRRKR